MEILQVALSHPPRAFASPASQAACGLSRALRSLGHDITVIVPYHQDYADAGLLAAKRISPLGLASGEKVDVLEAQLPSGVHLVLLDVPGAAEVPGHDGDELTAERAGSVGLFGRAVAAYALELNALGQGVDVVHAHDAEAGLCLLALSEARASAPQTVLSVHDARRAARADAGLAKVLGIPDALATAHSFVMGQQLCLLKGLLGLATRVVVPSPAYARNLSAPERHGALSRAFAAAAPVGIFDAVDVSVFNPATDSTLPVRFDAADPSPKGMCKTAMQRALELEWGADRPLILAEPDAVQGEVAALLLALPAVLRQDAQVILHLSAPLADTERQLLAPFVGQIRVVASAPAAERRRLLAAADFYLSIKKSDPGGVVLREAMRYGAVPLAFEADSASDHIIDCDAGLTSGTGFLMEATTQRAIASGVGRCLTAFRSPRFDDLRKRVMRRDASWDRPSRQMQQLYQKLLATRS